MELQQLWTAELGRCPATALPYFLTRLSRAVIHKCSEPILVPDMTLLRQRNSRNSWLAAQRRFALLASRNPLLAFWDVVNHFKLRDVVQLNLKTNISKCYCIPSDAKVPSLFPGRSRLQAFISKMRKLTQRRGLTCPSEQPMVELGLESTSENMFNLLPGQPSYTPGYGSSKVKYKEKTRD